MLNIDINVYAEVPNTYPVYMHLPYATLAGTLSFCCNESSGSIFCVTNASNFQYFHIDYVTNIIDKDGYMHIFSKQSYSI